MLTRFHDPAVTRERPGNVFRSGRPCRDRTAQLHFYSDEYHLARAGAPSRRRRISPRIDAPVSGTSAMVGHGDCTIFVAGARARADGCQAIFDAIAKKTVYLGEVGMASLAKLVTNLLVGLNTAALAEALVLGVKGGLDATLLVEILKGSAGDSKMLEVRGPLMARHRFEAQMKIDLFLKDFKLMLQEGLHLGVPLPLTNITQQLAIATAAAGRGKEDLAAIITTLERLAGSGGGRAAVNKK